ncbi:hypothetical protein ACFY3N_05325 [Streptomyces sp. NPDC000348]|uniref:hypothetical protein n=1 Tax=Streptomyces sp. NPDC000348 TaxID=3364538 RepID=UPI0036A2D6B9
MRALPARRIALGALCAALLAGLTGPAAVAADTAPERHRATSSAALLAQVRTVDADEHGLTPVVDLLKAALEADGGRLPAAETRKLGDAAKKALAKAADDDPVVTTGSSVTVTVTGDTEPTVLEDGLTGEELTALQEAVDSLLDLLLNGPGANEDTDADADAETGATEETDEAEETDADEAEETDADETEETEETDADADDTQVSSLVDELLARVDELVDALLGTEPQTVTLPAPADPARTPLLPGVLLPGFAPLTSVLVPS